MDLGVPGTLRAFQQEIQRQEYGGQQVGRLAAERRGASRQEIPIQIHKCLYPLDTLIWLIQILLCALLWLLGGRRAEQAARPCCKAWRRLAPGSLSVKPARCPLCLTIWAPGALGAP